MKSVIIPSLEYAGDLLERCQKVIEEEFGGVQIKAANVILGCSRRFSNAAVRAELGIHFLKRAETQESRSGSAGYRKWEKHYSQNSQEKQRNQFKREEGLPSEILY